MSWLRSRSRNSVFESGCVTSSPRKRICPNVARTSPTRVFAMVVLPHPLSPTRPNTSPSAMEKVTPSTAWTFASPPPRSRCTKPLYTEKCTFRSRTSRSGLVIETNLVQMAGDLPMVFSHEPNLREDRLADVHSFLAPEIERAAGRVTEKTGWFAGHRIQLRRLQIDHRSEKTLGVWVAWLPEQGDSRSLLRDSAGIHHRDAVCELRDQPQVVGDEEDRHVVFTHDRLQKLEDLRFQNHVEGGRRLIGDQQRRLEQEAQGDHDPLRHAPAQLVRVHSQAIRRDSNVREDFFGPFEGGFRLDGGFVRTNRLDEMIPNSHEWIQARHRVLENHREVSSAKIAHFLRRQRQQIEACEPDGSPHGRVVRTESKNRAAQGALPAAAFPDKARDTPALNRQVDVLHGVHLSLGCTESHGEVF